MIKACNGRALCRLGTVLTKVRTLFEQDIKHLPLIYHEDCAVPADRVGCISRRRVGSGIDREQVRWVEGAGDALATGQLAE